MNTSDVRPVAATTLSPPFYIPPFADYSAHPTRVVMMPYALPERRHRHSTDQFEKHGSDMLTYSVSAFVYNSIMLFLPYFYRSRLHQVLHGVRLTKNELISLVTGAPPGEYVDPKCWEEVRRCWSEFIDSVLQEWKTLNIVSALLLTAIYKHTPVGGIWQPLRAMYGTHVPGQRSYELNIWLLDILSSSRTILWNVYILLALPSIWLAWSLILFLICLMAIVWQPEDYATHTNVLGPLSLSVKIAVSTLLAVGFVQLLLILETFFRYGGIYDKRWAEHLNNILYANSSHPTADDHPTTHTAQGSPHEILHENSVPTAYYRSTPYARPLLPGPYGALNPRFANSTASSYYSSQDTLTMSTPTRGSPLPHMFIPHYYQHPYYAMTRHTVPMSASSPTRPNARNNANNHAAAYEEAPLPPGFQYPAPLGRRQVRVHFTTAGDQQSLRDQQKERLNQMTSTSRVPTVKEESGATSPPGSLNATFVVDEGGNSSTQPRDEELTVNPQQGQSRADEIQPDS